MPVERLVNAADPRVAEYRGCSDAALLDAPGLFIAEGRLIVRRLIEQRRYDVRSVLVNDAAYRALEPVLASISEHVPIFICAASDFLGIAGYDIHRGCLALVRRPSARSADDLLEAAEAGAAARRHAASERQDTDLTHAAATPPSPITIVVLEGVANADNVGGVFRNVAALGGDGVLLDPACCDPLYRKAIRTSMAATLRVPFARVQPWPAGLDVLRTRGFTLVALSPRASLTLEEFQTTRPSRIALLAGTEGDGLTMEAEARAERRVRIPMAAGIDSLNLSVAVGIALHRLAKP
jgi:tRNA G18 (ribose-2'-O)-methylase SpoU